MKVKRPRKKVYDKLICCDCNYEFYTPKGGRCPNCGWDRYRFVKGN